MPDLRTSLSAAGTSLTRAPTPSRQRRPRPTPAAPPAPDAPKGPSIAPLGPAETIVHRAIRDGARIEITLMNGTSVITEPVAIGQYSLGFKTPSGAEVAFYKHAIQSVRRA